VRVHCQLSVKQDGDGPTHSTTCFGTDSVIRPASAWRAAKPALILALTRQRQPDTSRPDPAPSLMRS
jgi:hypothetical protein